MPPLVEKIGQLDLNQFEHEVNLIMNATCKTTKIEGNFAYGKLSRHQLCSAALRALRTRARGDPFRR